MIEIVQAPQTFNFSLSLPDFLLLSDQARVEMRVFDDEENVIISEIYDMPPSGQHLVIKLSRLIDIMLTGSRPRSEEHTSELQSRENLVCRLLLEKKK